MKINNYFIKLLILSYADKGLLLYGFSVLTDMEEYEWNLSGLKGKNKNDLCICTAILSQADMNRFIQIITSSEIFDLCGIKIDRLKLVERTTVLSNDMNQDDYPIKNFRKVIEYWNIDKKTLIKKIEKILEGKKNQTLYCSMVVLLRWLKENCGIDFRKNGHRLGNFELYKCNEYLNIIEIKADAKLKKCLIIKKRDIEEDLLVNCILCSNQRSSINILKEFSKEEKEIEFLSPEIFNRFIVTIWEKRTGILVFSKQSYLIMGIQIGISVSENSYKVKDDWSEKLLQSASNKKGIIEKNIETVNKYNKLDDIEIGYKDSSIYNAYSNSSFLLQKYKSLKTKGAFILNKQKDGEIESFVKIREYINNTSAKEILIADPYFSKYAAGKILTRIENTNVKVKVITSLVGIDPDSGKNDDTIVEEYKKYVNDNVYLFHNNLIIYNVTRGKKQVFHDRYLIRIFADGNKDGFLLSNSLNSMGQFYPFVIAPMEQEVCDNVLDYLLKLIDVSRQKDVPKKEKIDCDILFDSHIIKRKIIDDEIDKELYEFNNMCKNMDVDSNIKNLFDTIANQWSKDKDLACKKICIMVNHIRDNKFDELIKFIKNNTNIYNEFLGTFLPLSITKENAQKEVENPFLEVSVIRSLLDDNNIKKANFDIRHLFDEIEHVYYKYDKWLYGGYKILITLFPDEYIKILEKTKSPLMFSILYQNFMYNKFSIKKFEKLAQTSNIFCQFLCAEYILLNYKNDRISFYTAKKILRRVDSKLKIFQEIYIYLNIIYTYHKDKKIKKLKYYINAVVSKNKFLKNIIEESKFFNLGDKLLQCFVYIGFIDLTKDEEIKLYLMNEVIDISYQTLLYNSSGHHKLSKLISIYVKYMICVYGIEASKKIIKNIDFINFEIAVEPEIYNYKFDEWSAAHNISKKYIQILRKYLEIDPNSEKVKNVLMKWEKRLDNFENSYKEILRLESKE